jgi:hypothetical protein
VKKDTKNIEMAIGNQENSKKIKIRICETKMKKIK